MTQPVSFETYRGNPAANYERYFVPAIGEPLARDLIELAELRFGERVLDVACGTGVVTRFAAEEVGEAAVGGVDVNPAMLAVAREAVGDARVDWHEASAEALPLEDGSFDVVLCQMGLQFFPDRPRALREVHRVLRPGGRAVLNVPGPIPSPFAVLERALRRHIGPEAAGFAAAVFSLHDPGEVRQLLSDAGFTSTWASSARRTLELPDPVDFLWQYVYSTPLAGPVEQTDDETRISFQQEVVGEWEAFADGTGLVLELDVTTAVARRD
jgi:ubiquinone/menaquinone biosynthesis C-methylase UbiE